jgi:F-type H+-transporting ATPase subunit epsilon
MAEKALNLSIVAPHGKIYEGDITSLVAPGELGYLGILYNHAPLVTTLQPGRLAFKDSKGVEQTLSVKGDGFLEVLDNKITVLVQKIEKETNV